MGSFLSSARAQDPSRGSSARKYPVSYRYNTIIIIRNLLKLQMWNQPVCVYMHFKKTRPLVLVETLSILLQLQKAHEFSNARALAFVVLRDGGNR